MACRTYAAELGGASFNCSSSITDYSRSIKPFRSSSSMNDESAMPASFSDAAAGYFFTRKSRIFCMPGKDGRGTFWNKDTWNACNLHGLPGVHLQIALQQRRNDVWSRLEQMDRLDETLHYAHCELAPGSD